MCRPNPTIHTLNDYTPQEIADFCTISLLRQGKPGFGESGCEYLTADGLKCAAGFLFDESTAKDHSNSTIGDVFDIVGIPPDTRTVKVLEGLQTAHDSSAIAAAGYSVSFINFFMESVRGVIKDNGLDDSAINTEYARLYGDS